MSVLRSRRRPSAALVLSPRCSPIRFTPRLIDQTRLASTRPPIAGRARSTARFHSLRLVTRRYPPFRRRHLHPSRRFRAAYISRRRPSLRDPFLYLLKQRLVVIRQPQFHRAQCQSCTRSLRAIILPLQCRRARSLSLRCRAQASIRLHLYRRVQSQWPQCKVRVSIRPHQRRRARYPSPSCRIQVIILSRQHHHDQSPSSSSLRQASSRPRMSSPSHHHCQFTELQRHRSSPAYQMARAKFHQKSCRQKAA